ncbi:DRTGG domain-containing protein [Chloroflexota bacterium]
MVALYVTSSGKGSGRTAVCVGLGKHLLDKGKKVGFLKPVPDKSAGDDGIDFIKRLFSLDEPADTLSPGTAGVKEAYGKVSQGKDVIIVDGPSERKASGDIVKTLSAKVLVVEAYSKELLKTAGAYKEFGESLLGVVLNKVPKDRMEQARSEASEILDKAGIKLLGVLPEDRILSSITIGELAEVVKGEVLRGVERSAELVENVMLGALGVDPGPDYFGRKDNKAVVLRSERPDMQMAAMETSTRCMVLTGDTPLQQVVLARAEEKDMPIILVKDDVTSVVDSIEAVLAKPGLNQENKLPRLIEIMEQNLDFQALDKGLGLAG